MHDQSNGHQATATAKQEKPKRERPRIDVLTSEYAAAFKELQDARDRKARAVSREDQNIADKTTALKKARKALDDYESGKGQ